MQSITHSTRFHSMRWATCINIHLNSVESIACCSAPVHMEISVYCTGDIECDECISDGNHPFIFHIMDCHYQIVVMILILLKTTRTRYFQGSSLPPSRPPNQNIHTISAVHSPWIWSLSRGVDFVRCLIYKQIQMAWSYIVHEVVPHEMIKNKIDCTMRIHGVFPDLSIWLRGQLCKEQKIFFCCCWQRQIAQLNSNQWIWPNGGRTTYSCAANIRSILSERSKHTSHLSPRMKPNCLIQLDAVEKQHDNYDILMYRRPWIACYTHFNESCV